MERDDPEYAGPARSELGEQEYATVEGPVPVKTPAQLQRVLAYLYDDAQHDHRPEAYRMRQNPRQPTGFFAAAQPLTVPEDERDPLRLPPLDPELAFRVVGTDDDTVHAHFEVLGPKPLSAGDDDDARTAELRVALRRPHNASETREGFRDRLDLLVTRLGTYSTKKTLARYHLVLERTLPAAFLNPRNAGLGLRRPGIRESASVINNVAVGYALLPSLLRHRTAHFAAIVNWYEALAYDPKKTKQLTKRPPNDAAGRRQTFNTHPRAAAAAAAATVGVRFQNVRKEPRMALRARELALAQTMARAVREQYLALAFPDDEDRVSYRIEQDVLREGGYFSLRAFLHDAAANNSLSANRLARILFQIAQALRAGYLDARFVHQALTSDAIDVLTNDDPADADRPFVYVDRLSVDDPEARDLPARTTHPVLTPLPAALAENAFVNELDPPAPWIPTNAAPHRVGDVQVYRVPARYVVKVHSFESARAEGPTRFGAQTQTIGLGALNEARGGGTYAPDPSLDLRTLAWDLLTDRAIFPAGFWPFVATATANEAAEAAEADESDEVATRTLLADFLFRAMGGPSLFAALAEYADAQTRALKKGTRELKADNAPDLMSGPATPTGEPPRGERTRRLWEQEGPVWREPVRSLVAEAARVVRAVPGTNAKKPDTWTLANTLAGTRAFTGVLAAYYAKNPNADGRVGRNEPTAMAQLRRLFITTNYVLLPPSRNTFRFGYDGFTPHTALFHPLFNRFDVPASDLPLLMRAIAADPALLVGLPPIPEGGELQALRPARLPGEEGYVPPPSDDAARGGASSATGDPGARAPSLRRASPAPAAAPAPPQQPRPILRRRRPRSPSAAAPPADVTRPPKRFRWGELQAQVHALVRHHRVQQAQRVAAALASSRGSGTGDGPVLAECAHCHAFAGLYRCRGCQRAFYCGPTCQRAAWTRGGHAQECRRRQ